MPSQPDSPEALLLAALEADHAPQIHREAWLRTARPEQLAPAGDWFVWLILAGRGFGKTRTASEDAAAYAFANPGARIALLAPTFADCRDVGVEGQSGLLGVIARQFVDTWNRSIGELILTNGSRFRLFSAEEPDRLRGHQHHRAYCDELASWKHMRETWDQLMFTLRLGTDPRVVVTTTPKPRPLIRELTTAARTVVTRGSTFDNAANLAPSAIAQLRDRYAGTRLGRQELEGEILEDTPGALWTRAMLEAAFIEAAPTTFKRVVVAVDPSGSDGESGDSQGIVVAALGQDGRAYVLEDATMRGSPDQWARRVAYLYDKHSADRVIGEQNYGGAMITAVLKTAAPNLPIKLVTATRGKAVRAEPIAALYEQGRVSHVGGFPELEDQMALMTGAGSTGSGSPDRLDALVWALTELMVTGGGAQGWFEHMQNLVAAKHGAPRQVEVHAEASPAAPASPHLVRLRGRPGMSLTLHLDNDEHLYTADGQGFLDAEPEHGRQLMQSGFRLLEGAHGR